MGKIAILLSGGVDSSVVAYLVKRKYKTDIVAFTLLLYNNWDDIESAKKVADYLKIPHEVLDLRKPFKERVFNYFLNSYKRGETPNPCAICNQEIKLGLATEILVSQGFEKIFTGHYVRKESVDYFTVLKRGKDLKKDQSYFLALLKPKYLQFLEFPLGVFTKEEVRKIAVEAGLPTRNRKESQDICFLEGKKLKEFLKSYIPPKAGKFIYKGIEIGTHEGYYSFTVGQRRGLGVRVGKPVYVKEIIADKNLVVLGDKEELLTNEVVLKKLNFFVDKDILNKYPLWGQIRYRTPAVEVEDFLFTSKGLRLRFKNPFVGVARGQIGALYWNNETLVAGGIVC